MLRALVLLAKVKSYFEPTRPMVSLLADNYIPVNNDIKQTLDYPTHCPILRAVTVNAQPSAKPFEYAD